MRMSRRERNLILLVLLIVVGYLLYSFVYSPQLDKIDKLKADIETKEKFIEQTAIAKEMIPTLETEINALEDNLKLNYAPYLGNIYEEDIVMLNHEILEISEVDTNAITLGGSQSVSKDLLNYSMMPVNFAVTGAYEDILSFLDQYWNYSHEIYVSGLSLGRQADGNVNANVNLLFTIMRGEYAEETNLFEWKLNDDYDPETPFTVQGAKGVSDNYQYNGQILVTD